MSALWDVVIVGGARNLRGVDASIFLNVPSVATNVFTLTAAEHIAAQITGSPI